MLGAMGLEAPLTRYLDAVQASPFELTRAKDAASVLLDAALHADVSERSRAVEALARDIERDGDSLVLSTVMAGALVERRAQYEPLERALFPRLTRWIEGCVTLLEREIGSGSLPAETEDEDGPEAHQWIAERLSDERPWALLGDTHLAAVAALTVNSSARRAHRDLLPALRRLAPYHPGAEWLRQLLEVLDDEPLVVIDVERRLGCSGKMRGVASNFELFVLIADAAGGDPARGFLALAKPPAAAVRCLEGLGPQDSGIVVDAEFNAYAYSALAPSLTLPEPSDYGGSAHWIWGEGEPWEIPALDGARVVLVGPPSYARLVPAQRTFACLEAKVELLPLSRAAVDEWLTRIARANAN